MNKSLISKNSFKHFGFCIDSGPKRERGQWARGPLTWNSLQNSLVHPFCTWVRARACVRAILLTNTLHRIAEDCQTFDFLGVPLQLICDSKIMGAITLQRQIWNYGSQWISAILKDCSKTSCIIVVIWLHQGLLEFNSPWLNWCKNESFWKNCVFQKKKSKVSFGWLLHF